MSAPAPRSPGREILIRLCFIAVILQVAWLVMARYAGTVRERMVPPQIATATQALAKNDLNGAKGMLDKYIAANSKDVTAYVQACIVSQQGKQWTWVRDYAQAGLQNGKDAPQELQADLYGQLSSAFSHLEQTPNQTKAIEAAQKAFALAPDDPNTLNALGYLLADNNQRLDEARTYLTRALHLLRDQPDSPETQFSTAMTEDSYGWLLYRQGDAQTASQILIQAIVDIPDPAALGVEMRELYYHLGAAHRKAGHMEAARTALETALRYDPNYAPAKAEMAELPPASPASPPTPTASLLTSLKPSFLSSFS